MLPVGRNSDDGNPRMETSDEILKHAGRTVTPPSPNTFPVQQVLESVHQRLMDTACTNKHVQPFFLGSL